MMDRAALAALLPCYITRDLPPALSGQVQEALMADPDLRALHEALLQAGATCERALLAEAPLGVKRWMPCPAPRVGWLGAVAGASLGLFGLVALATTPTSPERRSPVLARTEAVEQLPRAVLASSDPAELQRRLLEVGAPAPLARVADHRPLGWTLVGARWLGDRVTVVWRDEGGREVTCHMLLSPTTPGAAPILVDSRAGAPTLAVHPLRRGHAVFWTVEGAVCALAAELPAEDLLAAARRVAWPVGT